MLPVLRVELELEFPVLLLLLLLPDDVPLRGTELLVPALGDEVDDEVDGFDEEDLPEVLEVLEVPDDDRVCDGSSSP